MISILYTTFDYRFSHNHLCGLVEKMPFKIKEKITRFKRWEDAHACLLGNYLLLNALYKAGLRYTLEDLKYDDNYRPFLCENFDFNISHSGNAVVCASTCYGRIGVDIEVKKHLDISNFKDQFSSAEWEALMNEIHPCTQFYNHWTRKESVLKADGRGLSYSLAELVTKENDTINLDGRSWYCRNIKILDGYACHIAYNVQQDYVAELVNFSESYL
ncbi:4'-phosphopantetheinyl transferase superfamily protein [Danxiaibacter flavus]|uniref:4'-phosphopantetheinyl transferase superfamily protein n=1 Tax=Danxiaibacter flavus TaxID=3049108 RepID=A0ABV3ZFG2_9BACT|nr:4'-phosphopantetheinyl transferase superfamily protein [Chitinophagaceae bacterium DXS]